MSLAQAKDISKTLIIFSHDYYDEDINDLVQTIDFCKVLQVKAYKLFCTVKILNFANAFIPFIFRYFIRIQYKRISMNFLAKTRAIVRAILNETSKLIVLANLIKCLPRYTPIKSWQTIFNSDFLLLFTFRFCVVLRISRAIIRKCNNALYPDLYGHYREAKFTQTKHHWYVNKKR